MVSKRLRNILNAENNESLNKNHKKSIFEKNNNISYKLRPSKKSRNPNQVSPINARKSDSKDSNENDHLQQNKTKNIFKVKINKNKQNNNLEKISILQSKSAFRNFFRLLANSR